MIKQYFFSSAASFFLCFTFFQNDCFAQDSIHPLKGVTQLTCSEHKCSNPVFVSNNSPLSSHQVTKTIFQTWKTHELPDKFLNWSNSWKKNNPDWDYVLWDDLDNRNFIKNLFPWFLPIYDSYPAEIYRADAIRYFYLYEYGGLYVDLDFECLKNIEPLANLNCIVLGRLSDRNTPNQIPNAFMMSPPKAEFWLVVIYAMMNSPQGLRPEYTTGPVILKRALELYHQEESRNLILNIMKRYFKDSQPISICIRPQCELYPLNWETKIHEITPCSYAATYWTASWKESCNLEHENP